MVVWVERSFLDMSTPFFFTYGFVFSYMSIFIALLDIRMKTETNPLHSN